MDIFTPAKYALLFKLDNILIGHNFTFPPTMFKMHFFKADIDF